MDVSKKKTVLDDEASIYQRREEKSDRAKWKELKGFKAKWEHFKAYYLLKTFILLCVVGVVIYAVYVIVRPEKERLVYVAILDAVVLNEETEALQKGFEEYLGMDEENQETMFDNSMMISARWDTASQQKFTTYAYAGEIDVIIMTESILRQYAGVYFRPLSEQLPADLYENLSERFCYSSVTDGNGKEVENSEQPYGLFVTDLVEVDPLCKEELVLAICGNSGNEKNAEEFVRYILQRKSTVSEEQ